jgi:alkylation response protein AidB-like acyl-CoA dehydrogenase
LARVLSGWLLHGGWVTQAFDFHPFALPDDAARIRAELRDWLATHTPQTSAAKRANCWSEADPQFSRALGAAGYIGMCWPHRYGGRDAHPLARYVVIEELLAAGAPVAAHWIADRQTGPLLLKYGTEAQRERWLPGMVRGDERGALQPCYLGAGPHRSRQRAQRWPVAIAYPDGHARDHCSAHHRHGRAAGFQRDFL